jgi:fumarate hydratase class I
METAKNTGIGSGAGGSCFAIDAVVVRLPRHGASCPVSVGVSCSAHRVLNAVITKDGYYIEKTVKNPAELPGFTEALSYAPRDKTAEISIDTTQGISACLAALKSAAPGSRVLVSGPVLVARDAAHSRWKALLDGGKPLPDYATRYPILYAGPAETPSGAVCGSIGPTTAGRMDSYAELLMPRGAALITLAKGNRSPAWVESCKTYGAVYLGIPGGCAALIAKEYVSSLSTLDYGDLGMEAVRLLDAKNLPAFVLIDSGGNDFYAGLAGQNAPHPSAKCEGSPHE